MYTLKHPLSHLMPGALLLLAITLLFTNCHSTAAGEWDREAFSFVIEGEVKNGEGVELALHVPSMGLEKRITAVVVDGRYHFEGRTREIECAEILFRREYCRFKPDLFSCSGICRIRPPAI